MHSTDPLLLLPSLPPCYCSSSSSTGRSSQSMTGVTTTPAGPNPHRCRRRDLKPQMAVDDLLEAARRTGAGDSTGASPPSSGTSSGSSAFSRLPPCSSRPAPSARPPRRRPPLEGAPAAPPFALYRGHPALSARRSTSRLKLAA